MHRLKKLAESIGISVNKLEKEVGVGMSTFNKAIQRDSDINQGIALMIIKKYPHVSEQWLLSDWGKFTIEQIMNKKGLKVRTTKTGADIYARVDKSPRLARVIDVIQFNNLKFDITEQYANKMLKIIGTRLNLSFKLTTHVGRHTAATLLLEMGYSYEYVAEFLGVSDQTVKIYAKVTRVKLNREYEKRGGL